MKLSRAVVVATCLALCVSVPAVAEGFFPGTLQGLTRAAANALYCQLTGCTMTGSLTFSGVATDITTGTNEDLKLDANGTGKTVLADAVTAQQTMTFSNVATDITTGTNEDLKLDANGTGTTILNDATTINGACTMNQGGTVTGFPLTFLALTTDVTTGTNEDLTLDANGTGKTVLADAVTAQQTMTFSNVATDITTGTNEDLTLDANGTGKTVLADAVTAQQTMTFSNVATDIQSGTNEDLNLSSPGTGKINLLAAGNDVTFFANALVKIHANPNQAQITNTQGGGGVFMFSEVAVGGTSDLGATAKAGCFADQITTNASTDLVCGFGSGKLAVVAQQTATCAGGVLALDPTSSVVYLNANNAACVVTLGETNAVTGSDVEIVLVGGVSGAVTFPNIAGVHAGPTACTTTGLSTIASSYRIHYAATLNEYVGVSCTSN